MRRGIVIKPTGFNKLSPKDACIILDLAQLLDITFVERLAKAFSDRKFYVETTRGEKRLLVINTAEHYDWLEGDFRMCEYIATSGINIMQPVSMGIFRERVLAYRLYTWYFGEDLAETLTRMSHSEQFSAGKKTGELLWKLHALPLFEEDEPETLEIRFKRKVQNVIQSYDDNPVKSQGADLLKRYLQDNHDLLDNRPLTFTHGDCNTVNLMFTLDSQIGVIDLGWGNNCNDSWWDFREWKPKNPCELARIGVHPKEQKQGIGTLMLQHCFEIAKNKGFDGIRILVAKKTQQRWRYMKKTVLSDAGKFLDSILIFIVIRLYFNSH